MTRSERRHRRERANNRKRNILLNHFAGSGDYSPDYTPAHNDWIGRGPTHSKSRRVGRIVGVDYVSDRDAIADQLDNA